MQCIFLPFENLPQSVEKNIHAVHMHKPLMETPVPSSDSTRSRWVGTDIVSSKDLSVKPSTRGRPEPECDTIGSAPPPTVGDD